MRKTPTAALTLALLLAAAVPAARAAGELRPVQGPVILAKAGASPTYLWNASVYVAALLADKLAGDEGLRAFEATAAGALADKARTSHADRLTLKAIYSRTGDVSPVYGSATFTGVENVFTLTAARAALAAHAADWPAALAHGQVPAGLTLSVTGKLPPAS